MREKQELYYHYLYRTVTLKTYLLYIISSLPSLMDCPCRIPLTQTSYTDHSGVVHHLSEYYSNSQLIPRSQPANPITWAGMEDSH